MAEGTVVADVSIEHIRAEIEREVKATYEAKFVRDIEEFKGKLRQENDAALKAVIDEFKASQTPPSEEDVRKLLTQEYLTFDVEVPWGEGKKNFTIGELPQKIEKRFYKTFKEQIVSRASEIGAIAFNMMEGDVAKKLTTIAEALDPTFDIMADAVVMILNPREQIKEINREWVQDNLSSYRQWNIIYAQFQVNRLRDFFSQVSRGSKGMIPNLGANTRR